MKTFVQRTVSTSGMNVLVKRGASMIRSVKTLIFFSFLKLF